MEPQPLAVVQVKNFGNQPLLIWEQYLELLHHDAFRGWETEGKVWYKDIEYCTVENGLFFADKLFIRFKNGGTVKLKIAKKDVCLIDQLISARINKS